MHDAHRHCEHITIHDNQHLVDHGVINHSDSLIVCIYSHIMSYLGICNICIVICYSYSLIALCIPQLDISGQESSISPWFTHWRLLHKRMILASPSQDRFMGTANVFCERRCPGDHRAAMGCIAGMLISGSHVTDLIIVWNSTEISRFLLTQK